MPDTRNTFQIFTPLGGGYVSENHSHDPPPEFSRGWGTWAIALIALLLFATTAAAAVLATGRTHAPIPELLNQSPPSIFNKAPDGAGYRQLLF
jgi:hypothetical protein